ncbi:ABC transporter ATP-binding protein [Vagococcus sp. BWB3-3]|uniref:ABC transporter ATP-binding protein n=1 Tax=Vagococcus allomyrinae TaxID=2794353 RepID=A0A940PGI5_9ENTE|nr:ABC transporter ATP-binding protein [Vagococcus allomyrinae]MBP1044455.1 ABC transporter ATP-binding protein [Vagococcus allomyrinae]
MTTTNHPIAISVQELVKSFDKVMAVDHLSFTVPKGTIFGLLGHNGAGKSTTIDCLLGTQAYQSGHVSILGEDPIKVRKKLFQKVGVQFQETAFQSQLKVKEICQITHSLYERPRDWQKALETFGLADKKQAFVSTLSGGEKQKLCILLAVMGNPEVIFLDELTTGLDPKARREVWRYLHLLKEQGVTIFLTSHFMDEVENLCDQILILKEGKTIARGTVQEVIEASGQKNMDEAFLYLMGEEF